jgi:hypothetical protein
MLDRRLGEGIASFPRGLRPSVQSLWGDMSWRASYGRLPMRQVVTEDGPHPPVQVVTIAATAEPGSSSPVVPSACP